MFEMSKKSLKKGFTLIELLIAITIIGILSAALIPRIANVIPTARDSARKASLNDVVAAIEAYNLDNNGYPAGITGSNDFCLNAAGTTKINGATTYTLQMFLDTYLRGSSAVFGAVDAPAVGDCLDALTNKMSAKYTKLATGGFVIGVRLELPKSGNSKSINDLVEGDNTTQKYYVIKR